MSIVENIKSLCKTRGTTIPKLESELGFSKGSVYNWDKNSPSIDKIQKVADYFGKSTDYILYGYDRMLFTQLINYVRNGRTHEQFAQEAGIDEEEMRRLCMGLSPEQPSVETVEKIASHNPVDFLVDRTELLRAAGYDVEDEPIPVKPSAAAGALPALTPKDEREIAKDLETMLNALDNKSGMAAYNEPEDEEDRELLKASLLTSMRLAKQIAKKKFTPKKYRKE